MKILSSKKWKKFNDIVIDLQLELNDVKEDNAIYLKQIETLMETNRKLGNANEQITELKSEIKKLKTLCTKNNIDWKKLFEKEGK